MDISANLQWELHKNGNLALMLGHIKVGLVIGNKATDYVAHQFLPGLNSGDYAYLSDRTEAKQWVEDKVQLWFEKAGLL